MSPHATLSGFPSLEQMATVARQAGAISLKHFRKSLQITDKGDNQGIVTNADLASEAAIKAYIQEQFPGHVVLAEESGLSTGQALAETPLWIVDPIDGTTNFSKGNPYYCISIGFGMRLALDRCEMHAGVVYQPATGLLYTAGKGMGSFCNGERISVSRTTLMRQASLVTGFSSNKGPALAKVMASIQSFQDICLGVRINGAAALDLAHVACGMFEGFYEMPLGPWDMAAGSLLVTEAGGLATNYKGEPFDPLRDKGIVCAPPALMPEILERLSQIF